MFTEKNIFIYLRRNMLCELALKRNTGSLRVNDTYLGKFDLFATYVSITKNIAYLKLLIIILA